MKFKFSFHTDSKITVIPVIPFIFYLFKAEMYSEYRNKTVVFYGISITDFLQITVFGGFKKQQ